MGASIAAVLHDVVEDTDTTVKEVEETFGTKVAQYVDALSAIEERTIEQSHERCAELGKEALSIRSADLMQNSYYYYLASEEMRPKLKHKYEFFLNTYGDKITKSLQQELKEIYNKNVKSLV